MAPRKELRYVAVTASKGGRSQGSNPQDFIVNEDKRYRVDTENVGRSTFCESRG